MQIKLGEKIRSLRKEKNIPQEVLAQYLGVTFQAVSKWENGAALPDVAAIPAIAMFFGVSTDQLFDIHLLDIDRQVSEICDEAVRFRNTDPARGEEILRNGLKKFPGNDILLNNLLYFLRAPERSNELICLCKTLIAGTRDDAVKYDACRILAKTHKVRGEYDLAKLALEQIPEIYFTKLQFQALLLEGGDMYAPAWEQKELAAEMLVDMLLRLASYYKEKGEDGKASCQLSVKTLSKPWHRTALGQTGRRAFMSAMAAGYWSRSGPAPEKFPNPAPGNSLSAASARQKSPPAALKILRGAKYSCVFLLCR